MVRKNQFYGIGIVSSVDGTTWSGADFEYRAAPSVAVLLPELASCASRIVRNLFDKACIVIGRRDADGLDVEKRWVLASQENRYVD